MLTCIGCDSQIEPGRQGDAVAIASERKWWARIPPEGRWFDFARAMASELGILCLPCTESHARAKGAWREEEAS